MKIDHTQSLTRPTQQDNVEAKKSPATAAGSQPQPSSTTTLSQIDRLNDKGDIDTARVNEIRQAIADGQFELDTSKIADGLIADVKAQLGQE
ncbi:flagellar biosynthesis anti-sigma factor FlgM [Salinicola aestuarinus]|uniref:flagellar biosynthesis anti-sigma factor FlgM n=1 Tax=Salinicola aestuarinus TaxID=1949082 RepID=UPI000DA1A6B9|nr:flagellar biosynthesis anti-sigma factor FlgM [Salinicola aestuarinus]